MGLMDRDYYHEHHTRRDAARPSKASTNRSSSTSGISPWLLWLAVISALTIGFKWFLDARQGAAFPPTGQVRWYIAPKPVEEGAGAQLTLISPANSANFIVRLDRWETKEPVAMIPVRRGESARLTVPLGRYRVTMSKGFGWRDGEQTFRYTSESRDGVAPLEFHRVGNRVTGHRIRLESLDGNMETRLAWR